MLDISRIRPSCAESDAKGSRRTLDALQDPQRRGLRHRRQHIQVEVDCSGIKTDQDHFHTVGLPDAAVRESRDRVRAALKNCGYDIPPTHITINLAPADIKKEGSGFDLPMALGIVGAYGGLTKKEIAGLSVRWRALA